MKTAKRKRDAAPASGAQSEKTAAHASVPVVLASHCSIKDGAALKTTLLARVSDAQSVALHIGTVERVDTASMQLLCVFVRDRRSAGHAVDWQGSSAAMHEAARLLGMSELLALPEPMDVVA